MNSIKTALLKIENVTEVEIDKTDTITVIFDTDRAVFCKNIIHLGLSVKDMTHFT
jgi:copper chaperone CopZ